MAAKFFAILSLAVAASALPVVPVGKAVYADVEQPAHYEFQYNVQDTHSGDVKQQHEARAGDALQGSYSLLQPDGLTRTVDYSADAVHGFNAIVRYEGHATPAHAQLSYAPVAKVAYAAPVAKLAYPAPVTKLAYSPVASYAAPVASYAAPVAKLAYSPIASYAAPVAKVAYTAPLSQVSFSSPAISYHH